MKRDLLPKWDLNLFASFVLLSPPLFAQSVNVASNTSSTNCQFFPKKNISNLLKETHFNFWYLDEQYTSTTKQNNNSGNHRAVRICASVHLSPPSWKLRFVLIHDPWIKADSHWLSSPFPVMNKRESIMLTRWPHWLTVVGKSVCF